MPRDEPSLSEDKTRLPSIDALKCSTCEAQPACFHFSSHPFRPCISVSSHLPARNSHLGTAPQICTEIMWKGYRCLKSEFCSELHTHGNIISTSLQRSMPRCSLGSRDMMSPGPAFRLQPQSTNALIRRPYPLPSQIISTSCVRVVDASSATHCGKKRQCAFLFFSSLASPWTSESLSPNEFKPLLCSPSIENTRLSKSFLLTFAT